MADFGNLYEYNTASGVVIPQTSDIKTKVENALKEIFGNDFSTDESTPNGVLIASLVQLFTNCCGVNAQNASFLNLDHAAGAWLDNIGGIFGVCRLYDESDNAYRKRIRNSASRGSGFAASIRNALGNVSGVQLVTVLDNGMEDPAVLPVDGNGAAMPHSISVNPHSVAIFVLGGSSLDIRSAITKTKSIGCGTHQGDECGTIVSNLYYTPVIKYIRFTMTVSGRMYTGSDITTDAKNALVSLLNDNRTNATITKDEISVSLASNGKGITLVSCKIETSEDNSAWTEVSSLVLPAYRYITTGSTAEEKAAFLANNITVVVQ